LKYESEKWRRKWNDMYYLRKIIVMNNNETNDNSNDNGVNNVCQRKAWRKQAVILILIVITINVKNNE
jgi:hypothetical protein